MGGSITSSRLRRMRGLLAQFLIGLTPILSLRKVGSQNYFRLNIIGMATSSSSACGRLYDGVIAYPTEVLEEAFLVQRYKRFLADVKIPKYTKKQKDIVNEDGSIIVHCPNTGPMISLLPESRDEPLPCIVSSVNEVALQKSKRKYRYTLEMIQLYGNVWVGVHSALANRIVFNALESRLIREYVGYSEIRREVKVGDSTIDFELSFHHQQESGVEYKKKVLIEVKSVTLATDVHSDDGKSIQRLAVFPDCVSERAQRHARCLTNVNTHNSSDTETAIIFLIQRHDCSAFSASEYDLVGIARFALPQNIMIRKVFHAFLLLF